MNAYRKASVYVRDAVAGTLSETDSGYTFAYDQDYLQTEAAVPVSLTLPLTEKAYESKVLFPFIDGLISEGGLLQVVTKNWKLDQNDRFGLLLVACKDCIGAVRIEEVLS
jgi:serine/threonine-protein kinase HipA